MKTHELNGTVGKLCKFSMVITTLFSPRIWQCLIIWNLISKLQSMFSSMIWLLFYRTGRDQTVGIGGLLLLFTLLMRPLIWQRYTIPLYPMYFSWSDYRDTKHQAMYILSIYETLGVARWIILSLSVILQGKWATLVKTTMISLKHLRKLWNGLFKG